MDIKPIETIYKGYRFRSRLEARWAVFFDALKMPWEYEPEGFHLPSGANYLPDFRIKNIATQSTHYYEIKPVKTECARFKEFAAEITGAAEFEREYERVSRLNEGKDYESDEWIYGPTGDYSSRIRISAAMLVGSPREAIALPYRDSGKYVLCPHCGDIFGEGWCDYYEGLDDGGGVYTNCGWCDFVVTKVSDELRPGVVCASYFHKGLTMMTQGATQAYISRMEEAINESCAERFGT